MGLRILDTSKTDEFKKELSASLTKYDAELVGSGNDYSDGWIEISVDMDDQLTLLEADNSQEGVYVTPESLVS